MGRLVTSGFETTTNSTNVGIEQPPPFANTAAAYSESAFLPDASIFRSGAQSVKIDSSRSAWSVTLPQQASVTVFLRGYFRFTTVPTGTEVVIGLNSGLAMKITNGGKFQLWNTSANSQIGSDSSVTVTGGDGKWYRVELSVVYNATPQITGGEGRVDGVTTASTSGLTIAATGTQTFFYGTSATTGTYYLDDLAINDSTGSFQNSWPGDGKVVLLLPTSDNSAGSWRAGSAANAVANGALFNAINNTPPTGTATPDAATDCISNAISGATNPNGDFNMATYASAGITAADTINCITMIIAHGEDVATGAKTGTFNIQSNPAQGGTDTVGQNNSGQFGPSAGGAVGTWPSNWVREMGTVQYNPTVTVGTSPVCRITKTDTGTRAADCCAMYLYVDYTPAQVSGSLWFS